MNSEKLYKKALKLFPGGVNSPVRVFPPYPFFTKNGKGSKLTSVDGRKYIDYCMSYGALLFGHAYSPIIDTIKESVKYGTIFGTPSEKEIELAELIIGSIPSIEMVRFVNTGAEATMHSIRLARGFTNRSKIVKFEGCYHGAHDSVLVKAGSGAMTFGVPDSLGVTNDVAENTIVLPYNNSEKFESVIEEKHSEIAAVIVEPVIGNAGLIIPKDDFLQKLRSMTKRYEIVLIFDEVITGFRLGLGGAQEYFGVKADLVTYGKVIGGGLPFAFFGGNREIMEMLAPEGKVYQAGTYSGNPLCVSVALVVLNELKRNRTRVYSKINGSCKSLSGALNDIIRDRKVKAKVYSIASMFQIFFTGNTVIDYNSALTSNITLFRRYFAGILHAGIFVPPSQFETCFISTAHTEDDIDKTVNVIDLTMSKL